MDRKLYSKSKIGIVGFGFVGSAVAHGFSLCADIKIYDKYNNVFDSLEKTVESSDFLFVSVPTPMTDDGNQNLSDLNDVVENIVRIASKRKIVILKSTVVPGTTRNYAKKFSNHDFVFNPEFLTERSAKLDFINTARIILGGDDETVLNRVETLYRTRFSHTPIFKTTWEGAETVKYMANTFFVVKVSFLNEIFDIAEFINVPYNDLRDMWLADSRIGNSHTDVPGHDFQRGVGGKCFPKDLKSFIKWGEENNFKMEMFKAADSVNERVRKVKDWENIKGATTKYNYKLNLSGKEECNEN